MRKQGFIKIKKIVRNGIIVTIIFAIGIGAGHINDLHHNLKDVKVAVKKQEKRIEMQQSEIQSLTYELNNMKVTIQPKQISKAAAPKVETEKAKLKEPELLSPTVIIGGVVVATGFIITLAKVLPLLAL